MSHDLDPRIAKNLEKIATYLESLPEECPTFSNDMYYSVDNENTGLCISEISHMSSGNPICAPLYGDILGHAPAAGVAPLPEHFVPGGDEEFLWDDYRKYIIGDDKTGDLFNWLLNTNWVDLDDSPHGAAHRIRYVLKNGQPPENFRRYLLSGADPTPEDVEDFNPTAKVLTHTSDRSVVQAIDITKTYTVVITKTVYLEAPTAEDAIEICKLDCNHSPSFAVKDIDDDWSLESINYQKA